MKLDELLFKYDFLFRVILQWKRRQLMLFQVNCHCAKNEAFH